jgi:putative hydrolase of the HAD superfamily
MTVRTIIFDFGNVLGFFDLHKAARQLAAYARPGVMPGDIHAYFYSSELEPRFEVGDLTSVQVITLLRERFGLAGSDEQLALAYADMFTPNESVCNLIPALRGRYRLALLSNTNDLHYRHFRQQFAETLDLLHIHFVSHEVGLRKPDPRLYRHVQRRLECDGHECLFVDDLQANIAAAHACGWQGIVYQRGADLRQKFEEAGIQISRG